MAWRRAPGWRTIGTRRRPGSSGGSLSAAGWSAFAVVGGYAYTQEQRGEQEAVTCYDVSTGKLLWVHTNPVHFNQWQGGDGPRATPTVRDGRVFAIGATGILDCLEAGSGRLVWSRDVLQENKLQNLIWGVSASPLVFDDKVVVTGGLTDGPTVLAYRRSDGEPLWHAGDRQGELRLADSGDPRRASCSPLLQCRFADRARPGDRRNPA